MNINISPIERMIEKVDPQNIPCPKCGRKALSAEGHGEKYVYGDYEYQWVEIYCNECCWTCPDEDDSSIPSFEGAWEKFKKWLAAFYLCKCPQNGLDYSIDKLQSMIFENSNDCRVPKEYCWSEKDSRQVSPIGLFLESIDTKDMICPKCGKFNTLRVDSYGEENKQFYMTCSECEWICPVENSCDEEEAEFLFRLWMEAWCMSGCPTELEMLYKDLTDCFESTNGKEMDSSSAPNESQENTQEAQLNKQETHYCNLTDSQLIRLLICQSQRFNNNYKECDKIPDSGGNDCFPFCQFGVTDSDFLVKTTSPEDAVQQLMYIAAKRLAELTEDPIAEKIEISNEKT